MLHCQGEINTTREGINRKDVTVNCYIIRTICVCNIIISGIYSGIRKNGEDVLTEVIRAPGFFFTVPNRRITCAVRTIRIQKSENL